MKAAWCLVVPASLVEGRWLCFFSRQVYGGSLRCRAGFLALLMVSVGVMISFDCGAPVLGFGGDPCECYVADGILYGGIRLFPLWFRLILLFFVGMPLY